MAGAMARYNYVSDDGTTYRVRQDISNALSAGNTPASVTADKPGRMKPRYILAAHPTTARERRIVIGDPANGLWTGATNIISLPDFAAAMAATNFVVRGRIGERRLG
jgi:hypothetical protein